MFECTSARADGQHVADGQHLSVFARAHSPHTPKLYLPLLNFPKNVTAVLRMAGFNTTSVLLEGGSAVHSVNAAVLATGYNFCVLFLHRLIRMPLHLSRTCS
jgi:hypothetical protein